MFRKLFGKFNSFNIDNVASELDGLALLTHMLNECGRLLLNL